MKMEQHIDENPSKVSVLSIPKTESTHQLKELASLIAGINQGSQLRLTVAASDVNLNHEVRQTQSADILKANDSNLASR